MRAEFDIPPASPLMPVLRRASGVCCLQTAFACRAFFPSHILFTAYGLLKLGGQIFEMTTTRASLMVSTSRLSVTWTPVICIMSPKRAATPYSCIAAAQSDVS